MGLYFIAVNAGIYSIFLTSELPVLDNRTLFNDVPESRTPPQAAGYV